MQESWDQNSAARNATIDMLNRMIALSASLAELANSRNAVTASEMSGANRSGRYQQGQGHGSQPADGLCENPAGDEEHDDPLRPRIRDRLPHARVEDVAARDGTVVVERDDR